MNERDLSRIRAATHLHHAWLLGLQLMVSSRRGPKVMGDWMFRLFRRQHLERFLPGLKKLGLADLPPAVACAGYHTLSNRIGGVEVEFIAESDRKAWVRFRYPRWIYAGPTLCGLPVEVSRGFLFGWYAQNGVSLGNPRLGFVCVSEDMTGEFGLCGYFMEYDHALTEEERLRFAPGELPPPFDPAAQPGLKGWSRARLEKARRNYVLDFIRSGLAELRVTLGSRDAGQLASHAAQLTGLQYYREICEILGQKEQEDPQGTRFIAQILEGLGDETAPETGARLVQKGLRIAGGLEGGDRDLLLDSWSHLFRGALKSRDLLLNLAVDFFPAEAVWTTSDAAPSSVVA